MTTFRISYLKKAAFTVCLFLYTPIFSQSSDFQLQYQKIIEGDLLVDKAALTDPEYYYLTNFSNTLRLYLNEDISYELYESGFENSLEIIKNSDLSSPLKDYFLSEVRLQGALFYLKSKKEIESAWQLRQAYKLAKKNVTLFPGFIPSYKTLGLMQVVLGSVPEKYQWLLSLAGMKTSINEGLGNLSVVIKSNSYLKQETSYLKAIIEAYILGQNFSLQFSNLTMNTQNDLDRLIQMSIYSKKSKTKEALKIFEKDEEAKFNLIYYMAAEGYMQQGNYDKAIKFYTKYLKLHKGYSNHKDSYYKLYLAASFKSHHEQARQYIDSAKMIDIESTAADKYASKMIESDVHLNQAIMKMRLATDGGFYERADSLGNLVTCKSVRDTMEFTYRKARLQHKQNNYLIAKRAYHQTLSFDQSNSWYFQPNAALQLGYIYESENKTDSALLYFNKSKSFRHHEYKNSIDSKAEAAINRIKGR